jgi:hypothetical protein
MDQQVGGILHGNRNGMMLSGRSKQHEMKHRRILHETKDPRGASEGLTPVQSGLVKAVV